MRNSSGSNLPFPLEFQAVNDLWFLLPEVPQMHDVVGGGRDEGAFVRQELDLDDRAFPLVLEVGVHSRAAQTITNLLRKISRQQGVRLRRKQTLKILKTNSYFVKKSDFLCETRNQQKKAKGLESQNDITKTSCKISRYSKQYR